jgi:hypothetical protein
MYVDELLARKVFATLLEVKELIARWRKTYDTVRPRSSLGYRPPAPAACPPQFRLHQRSFSRIRSPQRKTRRPYRPHVRTIRLFMYPHGESNFCRILWRYRSRGKFRTKFRTSWGGPRRREPRNGLLGV